MDKERIWTCLVCGFKGTRAQLCDHIKEEHIQIAIDCFIDDNCSIDDFDPLDAFNKALMKKMR